MAQLVWFAAGIATTLVAVLLLGAHRRRSERATADADGGAESRDEPRGINPSVELSWNEDRDLESLATSIGEELANLVTGVEGHARLLVESTPPAPPIVDRARHLEVSTRRVRRFSEKILSFSRVDDLEVRPLDIRPFLGRLAQEIELSVHGIRVELAGAEFLPRALAAEEELRNALLFLVDTLLHLDRNTNRLQLHAFARPSEEQDTRIDLEIAAETDTEQHDRRGDEPGDTDVQLGYIAARNLLDAQGATLSFDELEGIRVTCYVGLATATPEPLPIDDDTPEQGDRSDVASVASEPHQFGGVLILENDAEIRDLIVTELSPTDRKLVTCIDGASARALLEATPERFELVVLEHESRIQSGVHVARLAAEKIEGVKILLLTTGAPGRLQVEDLAPKAEILSKPFGIDELRDALARLLGAAPSRNVV